MIGIKEVQLSITLPIGGIGIVVLQPFIEIGRDEPYKETIKMWNSLKMNYRQIRCNCTF
jgi:hypothetical protein